MSVRELIAILQRMADEYGGEITVEYEGDGRTNEPEPTYNPPLEIDGELVLSECIVL